MKTIKIAPSLDEIVLTEKGFHTDFAGGITYEMPDFPKIREVYNKNGIEDSWLKLQFRAAISISSNRLFLENLLNYFFQVDGRIL